MLDGRVELDGLHDIVDALAKGLEAADALRPVQVSRTGRVYKAGIGPFSEDAAVRMAVKSNPVLAGALTQVPYPGSRQTCDLQIATTQGDWAIEVKMARFRGDNGKPDDTAIKDILSPWPTDRSALTDCSKLVQSKFASRLAIIIYGFDDRDRPLDSAIEAFECLAGSKIALGARQQAALTHLVHPVHRSGMVFGWEIMR